MMTKDDLALSLSLGGAAAAAPALESRHPSLALQLNLTPACPGAAPPSSAFLAHQKAPPAAVAPLWGDLLASASSGRQSAAEVFPGDAARHFLKGIDVNRVLDEEEEAGISSPNSTVSSVVSGEGGAGSKRSEREDHAHPGHCPNSGSIGDDNELARASSRGISDEEDAGEGSRKKLRLSKEQSAVLEESFKEHNTLNPKQKLALAKQLNLRPRQVEVWFQNRRARTKLKQTEVDCEFLKRCCENLTEENRRLQKEVQELRALKLSPHLYMHMTPPTTLTMCPSCERVAVSSATGANLAAASTSSGASAGGPSQAPSASANRGAGAAGHYRQQPLHQQPHHGPHFLPAAHQHRPIVPMAASGGVGAAGHSLPLPWAPTAALRSAAFVDAPHLRS